MTANPSFRPDPACVALRWSLALYEGLIAGGLRQLVLSPGSRSTPLVLAARRLSALTLTPILDERSAAFHALGLARASGRPVALLCTSGSAPAHWFPAVMEASESELPLILLSADRPPELRGRGANQTVDQTRLFGGFAREFQDPGPPLDDPAALRAIRALGARAAAVSQGPRPGPVHLNLPFREPLVPDGDCPPPELPDWAPADGRLDGASANAGAAAAMLDERIQRTGAARGQSGEGPGLLVSRISGGMSGVIPDAVPERGGEGPPPVWFHAHSPGMSGARSGTVADPDGEEPPPVWFHAHSPGMSGARSGTVAEPDGEEARPVWSPTRPLDDPRPWLRGRGLICCGPGAAPPGFVAALRRCAETLNLPVLADPLSGLRCGPGPAARIARYDSLLRHAGAARLPKPDWVLRFGRAPVSRVLQDWLAGIPALRVDPGGAWSDPGHDARLHLTADPAAFCAWLGDQDAARQDPDWPAAWLAAEARVERLATESLAAAPWCEAHLIQELLARLPADEALLCANSLPIRQLDTWSGLRAAPLALWCNRGVSGIDGQTSTLAGCNAGGRPTTGLLGDLSFRHDLSGLLLLPGLRRPCIVIDNGGGRIFDELPQGRLPDCEWLWRTPRPLDLAALATVFGIPHRAVADGPGFRRALDESLAAGDAGGAGAGLIEVRIDASVSQRVHREFRALAGGAV